MQDCPDISACTRDVSELRGKLKAQGGQLTELQQVVEQLKVCVLGPQAFGQQLHKTAWLAVAAFSVDHSACLSVSQGSTRSYKKTLSTVCEGQVAHASVVPSFAQPAVCILLLSVLLQADLAATNSKRTEAEGKLSTAQADAKSAKSDLSKLEKKLSSTTASLGTAQSKLARAESDLVAAKTAADAAAGAGSSCKLSLKRAESQISEQKSRLEELKAVEEALLPVWLSRRLIQAQTFTVMQFKALRESDLAAQAAAKVAPYYEQATAAVAPYWEQAMEVSKPARETATVYYQQAKVRVGAHAVCATYEPFLGPLL